MESTRERRLTHLSLSKGDKYLLASTAAGEVQVWDLHDAAWLGLGLGLGLG